MLAACSRNKPQSAKKAGNPFYAVAAEHLQKGRKDSAFVNFSRARDWYFQAKDTVGAGVAMINMALISTDMGDRYGGQELSLEAAGFFDEENPQHHAYLLSVYNNLGIASVGLKQYTKAIEFYTRSLKFISDSVHARIVRNNIANVYRDSGDLDKAIGIYDSLLRRERDTINRARILSNYSYTRWLRDPGYPAEAGLREALNLRRKAGGLSHQNSSFAHLADYYKSRNRDSALFYSGKMYEASGILSSAPDQLAALQKLIALSPPEAARSYFDRYLVVEDSIRTASNNAKNQFALIRYETEKHKADKLELEKKNTIRNAWIIALSAILFMAILGAFLWNKRRERYLALKAADAVKESRLKTSKKVHDVVANGLYRVMSEVENNSEMDRERMLDELELLYEKSRDISYDDPAGEPGENFAHTIAQLIQSFATPLTKVLVAGNDNTLWNELGLHARTELKYVIQELMVNMTKHSQASSVAIRFERQAGVLGVYYSDNGLGIAKGLPFGNGLNSTGNRIKSLGGDISFETGSNGGLRIEIKVPLIP
jgi:tetratricopeptide (TPR) repeat protein